MQIALTPARSQHPYSSSHTHTHSLAHTQKHPPTRARARAHTHSSASPARTLLLYSIARAAERSGSAGKPRKERPNEPHRPPTVGPVLQRHPSRAHSNGPGTPVSVRTASHRDVRRRRRRRHALINHQPLSHGWQRARASAATVAHPTAEQQRSSQC